MKIIKPSLLTMIFCKTNITQSYTTVETPSNVSNIVLINEQSIGKCLTLSYCKKQRKMLLSLYIVGNKNVTIPAKGLMDLIKTIDNQNITIWNPKNNKDENVSCNKSLNCNNSSYPMYKYLYIETVTFSKFSFHYSFYHFISIALRLLAGAGYKVVQIKIAYLTCVKEWIKKNERKQFHWLKKKTTKKF